MGSPPPEGSKNEVFKFRSVRSMVIAPANTGRDRRRIMAVKKTDHTKRGVRSHVRPIARMLMIVVIKFTAPRMEEGPANCKLKIDRLLFKKPRCLKNMGHHH